MLKLVGMFWLLLWMMSCSWLLLVWLSLMVMWLGLLLGNLCLKELDMILLMMSLYGIVVLMFSCMLEIFSLKEMLCVEVLNVLRRLLVRLCRYLLKVMWLRLLD